MIFLDTLKNTYSRWANRTAQKRSLNYVWINHTPSLKEKDTAQCCVPLTYLDLAYDNAKKYPDVEVNIWIDYTYLDQKSLSLVQEHSHSTAPNNVNIKDLKEIPAYKNDLLFTPEEKISVWARVDFARLLVMKHVLNSSDTDIVIYSDFDVTDVKLDHAQAQETLSRYGMLFGAVSSGRIENGYLALDQQNGKSFLTEYLLPKTQEAAEKNIDGYAILSDGVINWANRNNVEDYKSELGLKVLERRGHITPPNSIYLQNNLNR